MYSACTRGCLWTDAAVTVIVYTSRRVLLVAAQYARWSVVGSMMTLPRTAVMWSNLQHQHQENPENKYPGAFVLFAEHVLPSCGPLCTSRVSVPPKIVAEHGQYAPHSRHFTAICSP